MALALALGRRGRASAGPTRRSAVLSCRAVGSWAGDGHSPAGRPHAETEALKQAGEAARGATAYVSLEPCSHHGKTPPCAKALIDAGVARVVSAIEDNDPRVAGQGFAMLRDAGIEVETGVLAEQAARDHAGFFLKNEQGRPFVTLKLASSFDGRIAHGVAPQQMDHRSAGAAGGSRHARRT